jgi:hypothetical protein
MDKKRQKRYIFAVYLIVALLAIIFFFVANYFFSNDPIGGLLNNLASEFIGVVLLFFMVNQFFMLDENSSEEKSRELLALFESKFAIVTSENQALERIKLSERLKTARNFSILALSASRLLKDYKQEIVNSVMNGTNVRILLITPNGQAANLLRGHIQEFGGSLENPLPQIELIGKTLNNVEQTSFGHFEARFVDWLPSCRLLHFDNGDGEGEMIVNMYSPAYKSPPYGTRLSLVLSPGMDIHWYRYFSNEFEKLWSGAIDWKQIS